MGLGPLRLYLTWDDAQSFQLSSSRAFSFIIEDWHVIYGANIAASANVCAACTEVLCTVSMPDNTTCMVALT